MRRLVWDASFRRAFKRVTRRQPLLAKHILDVLIESFRCGLVALAAAQILAVCGSWSRACPYAFSSEVHFFVKRG